MSKKSKLPPVVVGSVVAFNELPDPVWFDVLEINSFQLTLREHGKGPEYREQYMDKSLVRQVKADPKGKPANLPLLSAKLNQLFR